MTRTKPIKPYKRQKGMGYKYDRAFKVKVARYYLENDCGLVRVGELFNVSHQNVSTWANEFSSQLAEEIIISPMTEQEQKDLEALKKQIAALQKKLEYEQMRNFALETMADLAKTELGIDIRKNFGAKQPKE
jgi:transposase-like protein